MIDNTEGIHNLTHENMANFYGSEQFFFNPLFRAVKYTQGVQFVNANGANWLVVLILSTVLMNKEVKKEDFVCVEIKVKNKSAVVTFSDGDEHVLYKQNVEHTDFPLDTMKFFYTDGVLMLASEY